MIKKIQSRLASESGFTLIELLVVIIIIGILVAIAVPSYLSFRDRANEAAAKANVRSAVPAAESIYQQTNSYATVTGAALRTESPGVSATVTAGGDADAFCITDTVGSNTYHFWGGTGGDSTVATGDCSASSIAVS